MSSIDRPRMSRHDLAVLLGRPADSALTYSEAARYCPEHHKVDRCDLPALPTVTCPTCNHSAADPWRSRDKDGAIIHGCIDACHGVYVCGDDRAWHMRKAAVVWRKTEATRIASYQIAAEV